FLDRRRYAVQRPALATLAELQEARLITRLVVDPDREGVELVVARGDARRRLLDDTAGDDSSVTRRRTRSAALGGTSVMGRSLRLRTLRFSGAFTLRQGMICGQPNRHGPPRVTVS